MTGVKPRFQWRRGSTSEWAEWNPVLEEGEPGVEEDTGKFKIGNGTAPWSQLSYFLNENDVEVLITEMIEAVGGGTIDLRVGDLNALTTTVKTNLVAAINELNNPLVSYRTLYNNAKAG